MKPVSNRRRRRDRNYRQARQAAYRRAEGRCEAMVLGCTGRAEQIHHVAGRGGDDPHRLENLKALCTHCHTWVHSHPVKARRLGLSASRMGEVTPHAWTRKDET